MGAMQCDACLCACGLHGEMRCRFVPCLCAETRPFCSFELMPRALSHIMSSRMHSSWLMQPRKHSTTLRHRDFVHQLEFQVRGIVPVLSNGTRPGPFSLALSDGHNSVVPFIMGIA